MEMKPNKKSLTNTTGKKILSAMTNLEQQITGERMHHRFSPSSLQMREACACFENRKSTNAAAEAGTRQHAVTETGIDDNTLGDDQALHAAQCLDFYERLKQSLVEERELAMAVVRAEAGPNVSIPLADVLDLCESYLPVDDLKFRDIVIRDVKDESDPTKIKTERVSITTESTTAGYVDRALINWNRTRAIMLDYKFGAWGVEKPENNLQAIAYVLGLFRAYPTIETIEFYFKLPQLAEVTYGVFTRAQFGELYLRVQTVVARAREAHRRLLDEDYSMATPRVPACNFCANIGECPKVAEFACKVGHKFHPLEIPGDLTPTGLKTGDDASVGIRLSQVLAVWCKAFRSAVSDRVIRGDAPLPPGFRVEQRSDREVIDSAKLKEIALRHITTTELDSLAKYAFGAIEELISTNAPRGSKKDAVEQFQEELINEGAVKRGSPYSFLKAVYSKTE